MVDFLFALIERFRYLLQFRSYEAKCVQLRCRQGRPQQPFLTLGNPMAKTASLALRSLVLIQYRSVTDGQMDRQTGGRICRTSYTAALAERCKKKGFS